MTDPQQPIPVDPGNPLLAETPAVQYCTLVPSPTGQRLALTIRTPSTTLTVLLAKPDAERWLQNLAGKVAEMSSAGLFVASTNGIPTKQNGSGR